MALYLLVKTPKVSANKFLAAMLFMISIRTFKSVLFYFNPEITKSILQIGLSACFLIGPLLYFFCLSHTNQLKDQRLSWPLHMLTLVGVILFVSIFYPYQQFEELWGDVFYKMINYVWLLYIGLSLIAIYPQLIACLSSKKIAQDDVWLFTIFVGNTLIWLAYFTANYTSYIVGALSFSFILLIISLLVIFKFKNKEQSIKYENKKIATDEANEILQRLNTLMVDEKLYQNSVITMPQVAKRLGMSTPRFSQLLNDNLHKSFSTFVNEYRIEEAKIMLLSPPAKKMEVIAEHCGFNSQSTFYSAFKKVTAQTPAKFKAENSPNL
ncbi:helix-turn-helix domain-containing protein [Colwelliaceae bacterium 6441]